MWIIGSRGGSLGWGIRRGEVRFKGAIKNPVDVGLRGFQEWRTRLESKRCRGIYDL